MDTPTLFSAFIAGILTFLSPCILPLLPGYLSFISGESIENLKTKNNSTRMKVFLGALSFGTGFTTIFVILGASATTLGQFLSDYKLILSQIAGILIIILGIHMLGLFKINFLLKHSKVNYKKRNFPFFIEAFILGLAFVLGWTPCVGPILSGILSIAAFEESIKEGVILLFVYSLGLWIPFLLSALAVNESIELLKKYNKVVYWIEKISGILLILIGIALFTNNMTKITVFFIKVFPFLSNFNI